MPASAERWPVERAHSLTPHNVAWSQSYVGIFPVEMSCGKFAFSISDYLLIYFYKLNAVRWRIELLKDTGVWYGKE